MRMPMTAEDIVVSIFFHLQEEEILKVTADRETLHKAFFIVKENHPEVMKVFTFRDREVFPESTQLDQALSNLDATGLISRQNLVPRYYRFEGPLKASYDKFSKQILDAAGINEQEIRTIAHDLIDRLKGEILE